MSRNASSIADFPEVGVEEMAVDLLQAHLWGVMLELHSPVGFERWDQIASPQQFCGRPACADRILSAPRVCS